MKRIFSLLLALCLMFCTVLPVMAAEVEPDGVPALVLDSGEQAAPEIKDSGTPSTPSDVEEAPPEAPTIGDSDEAAANPLPEPATPGDAEISPLSDFGGGDATFTTRIRLTATDREGNPIAGAVYGLYAKGGTFIQELVTDEYGIALSGDVPVNTDYYVVELTAPEGWQPNEGQQDIILTDVCAPSRIDITAGYDRIMGQIKVIKTDPDGNPLSGAGFTVYDSDSWTAVDDITTGEDGTAITGMIPYGDYQLYEHTAPEGFGSGGYFGSYSITQHGEITEAYITDYPASGSLKITKTGNDGRKIQGAVFGVYKTETEEWVQDAITGSNGSVYVYSLPLGDYYAVEKSVPAPYQLDETRRGFSLTYDGEYSYLDVTNNVAGDSGKVKIIKTDDSGNPLSGVVFSLYRTWDGKKLADLTTGTDGTAESGPLIPGSYYLVETTGKPGYSTVAGQLPVTIDGTGATVEQTVINPKIRIFGKVKVMKQDDAGSPVSGVRFGVYCDKGNLLEELTTGADGTAVSGALNEGSYYLQELEGVAGYLSDTGQRPFSITENETVVPVTVINPRITGSVKVVKTGDDGYPLYGVVFGVYRANDDSEVCRLTTGWNGETESKTLYYGDYYLKELETEYGYELIDTPIPFSILEQDTALTIPVTNPMILGGVSILKLSGVQEDMLARDRGYGDVDEEHKPLSGAVFGVYTEWGQKLAELVTGEDGRAEFFGLPQGDYYLKELKAPEGFILIDELIPFSIWEQGEIFEAVAYNPEGFGTLKILKTGEDGEPLSGVAFDVLRVSTGEKAGELITDEAGAASVTLPLGRYELVETATASGYVLLSGKVSVTLTGDGAAVELPIMNRKETPKPDTGNILLTKTDADTGAVLPGAAFGIYRVSDDAKAGEITTGTDGTATSLSLPAGDYYLLELRAPAGYEISKEKYPVTVKTGDTVRLAATNKALPPDKTEPDDPKPSKTYTVEITKKADGTGELLKGAVFGVYRESDDKKVTELTTGRDGTASVELENGGYYLRELEAPTGYRLKSEKITFYLDGKDRKITVWNQKEDVQEKTGTLRVVKTDEGTGERLKGAVFAVYDEDGNKIDELTTDRKGVAVLELPAGRYSLREQEAPKHYVLDRDRVSFTVKPDKTVELEITNERKEPAAEPEKGGVRLIKTDTDGKPLAGAVFALFGGDGGRIAELTTSCDGTAVYQLAAGRYYLLESAAPSGFWIDTEKHDFTVEAGAYAEVKAVNERMPAPVEPPAPVTPEQPNITIPKTGEPFPALQYALAACCFALAGLCAAGLRRKKETN